MTVQGQRFPLCPNALANTIQAAEQSISVPAPWKNRHFAKWKSESGRAPEN
jgi:hypothetical protein